MKQSIKGFPATMTQINGKKKRKKNYLYINECETELMNIYTESACIDLDTFATFNMDTPTLT